MFDESGIVDIIIIIILDRECTTGDKIFYNATLTYIGKQWITDL